VTTDEIRRAWIGPENKVIAALRKSRVTVCLSVIVENHISQESFTVESFLLAQPIIGRSERFGIRFSVDGDSQHSHSLISTAIYLARSVTNGAIRS